MELKQEIMQFIPGCPTGLVNHVDKNGRPDILIGADVKVVSKKKVSAW